MKTYSEAVRFLYGLEVFGMKFGLKGIGKLLRSINDPQNSFPTIHVAGTNGKGSTSSMLAAILTSAGYKTGLYTSPHLVSFTERIRINGRPIPPGRVIRLTTLIHKHVRQQKATFFEAVTAMAFKYFADEHVDIAIIETGLGGRLDATNVLLPKVSVITNVSLEHTAILGKTLEKIVREKGGIIKPSTPCVTGIRSPKLLKILHGIAGRQNASLITTSGISARVRSSSLKGLVADVNAVSVHYPGLSTSLVGNFQLMNLKVVLRTIQVLRTQDEFLVEERDVRNGLKNVRALAGLQARLSVVRRNPLILTDVAHNPDATKRLVESLRELGMRNVLLVLGVVQDKDYRSMIRLLRPVAKRAIITAAKTSRSRSIADLTDECLRQGIRVAGTERNVSAAVERAISLARRHIPILITGSHYVVGEVLAFLRPGKST